MLGAKNIFLVGYDMQKTGALSHWHGDHPKGWGNSDAVNDWVKLFNDIAADLKREGVKVVNCTTETALTCFDRKTIKGAFNDNDLQL